jgi:hypothetical protein
VKIQCDCFAICFYFVKYKKRKKIVSGTASASQKSSEERERRSLTRARAVLTFSRATFNTGFLFEFWFYPFRSSQEVDSTPCLGFPGEKGEEKTGRSAANCLSRNGKFNMS